MLSLKAVKTLPLLDAVKARSAQFSTGIKIRQRSSETTEAAEHPVFKPAARLSQIPVKQLNNTVKIKVKQSRYGPRVAQRVPGS